LDPTEGTPIYLGETARRRRWIALALTILMPGLGHIYAGNFKGGLARYLVPFFAGLSALALWRVLLFQPHLPLLVAAAATLVYVGVLLRDVWEQTGPWTDGYVLQGFNHPLIYGGLLLFCHALPTALLSDLTSASLVATVPVRDHGMLPVLLPGDRVMVDRTAFRARAPERGELVAVHEEGSRTYRIRRVAAGPGDVISIEGDDVLVNLAPLPHQSSGLLIFDERADDPGGRPALSPMEGFTESNGEHEYIVTRRRAIPPVDTDPTALGPDEMFVLSDHRGSGVDSRRLGPIPRGDIMGRPIYVWWSRDPDTGRTQWHRIGLEAK
jgi:signal peptidase I